MEEEEKNNQKKLKIILASASPRRRLILQKLKIDFDTILPSGVVEKIFRNPYKTVIFNSSAKAQFIYNHVIINSLNQPGTVIAGFDTIIYLGGTYFCKPENVSQAEFFLKSLSGKIHTVITGVTLTDAFSGRKVCGYEVTEVEFEKLCIDGIRKYLKKEDVSDKAGAYDISGLGSILIKRINGCFYNVAGLPTHKFLYLLGKLGYSREVIY